MQYSETINPTQITINRVKQDFGEFCKVFRECVVLYYDLDKVEEGLLEGEGWRRGFAYLVMEVVFDSDDFYETVTQLQRKVDREGNDKIQFNMQKY